MRRLSFHKKHFTCNMHTRKLGDIGETIACKYIENKGFTVLRRNYRRRWGEIDIIGEKDGAIHFFEVKSVTVTTFGAYSGHDPEENVHNLKVRHIRRMIETYMDENDCVDEDFAFHVLCVYMNTHNHRARVKWLSDIVL